MTFVTLTLTHDDDVCDVCDVCDVVTTDESPNVFACQVFANAFLRRARLRLKR